MPKNQKKPGNDPYASSVFTEGRVDRKLRMLEAVARMLSDNYNVEVSFSSEGECKTTPESMILPYDKGVDEALILGLCGSETGHLKHTDFEVGKAIAHHPTITNKALLYIITNCLEDVRTEREMEREYIGFKEMFRRVVPYIKEKKQALFEREEKIQQLQEEGLSRPEIAKIIAKDCQKEVQRLASLLREAGFSENYIEYEVNQLKDNQTTPMVEISKILDVLYLRLRDYPCEWYPAEIVFYVDKLLLETAKEVYECENTSEVLVVAEKLYEILDQDQENQRQQLEEQQNQEGEGQEGDNSEDGEDGEDETNGKSGKGQRQDLSDGSSTNQGSQKSTERSPLKGPQCGAMGSSNAGQDGNQDEYVQVGVHWLTVGSEVAHLHTDQRGVVIGINNEKQEVEVEWEEKPSKE